MDPKDLHADSYPTLLEQGRALRRQGEWRRAEALFLRAAAEHPERLEPLLERARLHWGRNDVELAEDLLREAVDRHPREALPVVLLARLLVQRDAVSLAEEVIGEGGRRCPGHPLILLSEGELRLHRRDLAAAAICFERARASGASAGAVRAGLCRLALAEGNQLLEGGRADAAAFCFKRAADLRPQELEPVLQLGLAFLRLGCLRRAAAEARRALALGARTADLAYRAACLLRDSGDRDGAVATLERARHLDPQHPGARRALAELSAARQPARALLLYAEEAARCPGDAALWTLLGDLCLQLGDRRQALRCRREARRLSGEAPAKRQRRPRGRPGPRPD